jgi:hypothetical protein
MALTIKERYARIDTSKLPDKYKSEFEAIKDDTENFDPELVDIFQDNFDKLYSLTEKNYPNAIKKPGKIKKVRPVRVKKPVAKKKEAEPKKEMVHKSRGKAKFVPRSRGKKKDVYEPGDVQVEACSKILKEAGYTIKKRPAKSGNKVMKVKVQRQERTIIKDKVDDTFKTILKDVSGSKEKDEKYDKMQKALGELQELMTKLFNLLNNLAEDNSIEKVEKIISLMKKLVP